jgi:Kef-type K+ transport system membrane component KefB
VLPELPIEDVIIQFAVVIAAALSVKLFFEHTQVPGLIGLIMLGMLIGPGGLAILPEEPVVELFGSIGLLYIMFVAGAEIDLDLAKEHKSEAASFGVLAFAFSFVPAVAIGLLFGLDIWGALLLGAALSSHTLVAYPIISRLGLPGRRPVVAATGGTLLTDTASLVVLIIVIQLSSDGGGLSWLVPILFLTAIAIGALLTVPRMANAVMEDAKHTLPEKALLLLAILLVLSIAADLVGGEDILGAFLAGICLNRALHKRQELKDHLEFVGRMLFIPFFFVDTGMRLELEALQELSTWLLALLLVTAVIGAKSLAAASVARLFGYSRIEGLTIASLSYPQAAATLAVIFLGLELGLVDPDTADAIVIVIFVTCLVGPVLTRYSALKLSRHQPWANAD